MTKIIDSTGKGAAIDETENDANLSSLSGINAAITAATHLIDVDDQNDTIEYSRGTAIAVTLPDIADVSGANIHTDDFKVTLKNIGVGAVTITPDATDALDNGDPTIVLAQLDCVTIQTDSTLAIWNIIDRIIVDSATKTGTETLTNKTLTAPTINGGTVDGATVSAPMINEIHDTNDNEAIVIGATASAITYIEVTNDITGTPPTIAPAGETNVGLDINARGTGVIRLGGTAITHANQGYGGRVLLGETSYSSADQYASLAGLDGTYEIYVIEIMNFVPVTNNQNLTVQVQTGGSTWVTGNVYTTSAGLNQAPPAISPQTSSTTAQAGVCGQIAIYQPASGALWTVMRWTNSISNVSGTFEDRKSAVYEAVTAVTGVRLYFGSGNISSGIARFYGIIA